MKLARVRIRALSPFADVTVSFVDDGTPRPLTVLFGGDRTGKTTLLATIASTRPGFAAPPPPSRKFGDAAPMVICDYVLGEEDEERPHLLRVSSPTAVLEGESPDETAFRRKEQALFDRRAQEQGGFACVMISGVRWFSRTPNLLTQPERTVGRFDVRAPPVVEDATRADLTRETKQVLSYAVIGATLAAAERQKGAALDAKGAHLIALREALEETLLVLLEPFGRRFEGVALDTLEPIFRDAEGRTTGFEELPRGARHLVAIGASVLRAIGGAGPGALGRSLRERDCVALVDDIEAGQDQATLRALPGLLRRAIPGAQWILSTASPAVTSACTRGETVALRRAESPGVDVADDDEAMLH